MGSSLAQYNVGEETPLSPGSCLVKHLEIRPQLAVDSSVWRTSSTLL
jgi:hypothetical protein